MRRLVLAAVVVLVSTACVGSSDSDRADDGVPPEPMVTGGPGSTTTRSTREPALATTAAGNQVTIEVLASPIPTIGERWHDLAVLGYGGRPAAQPRVGQDVVARFGDLDWQTVELNWGVDSSASLVLADGAPAVIEAARSALAGETRWVAGGETWVAGVYQGGLAAPFEMESIVDAIGWIMAPDGACGASGAACPFGAELGFPPPPPMLALGAEAEPVDLPFEILFLGDEADAIEAAAGPITWIDGETAFTTRVGHGIDELNRGPATAAVSFGCQLFAAAPTGDDGPARVALRTRCDRPAEPNDEQLTWAVPDGWQVDGLAVTGTFGFDDYRLVVTARLEDGSAHAVAMPLASAIWNGRPGRSAGIDVGSLEALNPRGLRWTVPRRNRGGVVVVEERRDGWYLVADALGHNHRELVRVDAPIIGHAIDEGHQHIVLAVDGPAGVSNWWIVGTEVTRLQTSATSMAWVGVHDLWSA